MDSDNRLGDYLRARRAVTSPQEAGLPFGGRRRTPGLRREEVAVMAGVSTDYYVRLEQGRERNPSAQVLEALARVLRLSDEATAYLHGLGRPVARRVWAGDQVSENLQALMRSWPDTPAVVMGQRMEVLAANPLGQALFDWLGAEGSLVRAIFLHPAARDFYRDWSTVAENCVASLRLHRDPADRRFVSLVGELCVRSDEFAELWARHDVRAKTSEFKRMRHPMVGDLELVYETLTVNSAPGQQLVVYHAVSGSSSDAALRMLGSLAASEVQGASRMCGLPCGAHPETSVLGRLRG
ncbi:helix-turn-helix transcriptional regulator [Rhodococcus spelaei]|uniref:Helix-turn-helix transcriptional regulator n=1 Tax=Rhodococcus spelaei TaxID=2546320 RepID=A0A541BAL5_9NOCA|nr:helix-turn-helix transcriptional regulator [Rhodococcus spelaei]TQF69268.1 helix-turn-helix transcriptional regulator [Rhodococcus spelaei]